MTARCQTPEPVDQGRVPNVVEPDQEAAITKDASKIGTSLGYRYVTELLTGHRTCQHGKLCQRASLHDRT